MTRAPGLSFGVLALLFTGFCLLVSGPVYADTASDIQAQINAHSEQIRALEADVAAFQKELDILDTKKTTLQSAISSLALSQKQLASQIQVTRNKISSANLRIKELTSSIGDKEASITVNQNAIAKALRSIAEGERKPLVSVLISAHSFTEAWRAADEALLFNRALGDDITALRSVRTELATNRDAVTKQKVQLVSLQSELALQKRSVDASKVAQQQLLVQTKNQESNYQKLIAQKQAAQKSFEQQLANLESQLALVVHPGLLPKVGTGVLSWPFNNAFRLKCAERKAMFGNLFCITQYFGNTTFATANPQIYNNNGHNAIDIGTQDGAAITAALSGTVLATGNTDLSRDAQGRQCYSFGKWVMLKHDNGLSTLYAHLSEIDISPGQSVATGQVIGLSGRTGYATGPHLHFGVYATEGTQIMTLGKFKGLSGTPCANASMPVASRDAYLNPLSYL